MKLTLQDLNIIIDTMVGSRIISDGGNIWNYTREARAKVTEKLMGELRETDLNFEVERKS